MAWILLFHMTRGILCQPLYDQSVFEGDEQTAASLQHTQKDNFNLAEKVIKHK